MDDRDLVPKGLPGQSWRMATHVDLDAAGCVSPSLLAILVHMSSGRQTQVAFAPLAYDQMITPPTTQTGSVAAARLQGCCAVLRLGAGPIWLIAPASPACMKPGAMLTSALDAAFARAAIVTNLSISFTASQCENVLIIRVGLQVS